MDATGRNVILLVSSNSQRRAADGPSWLKRKQAAMFKLWSGTARAIWLQLPIF